MDERTLSQPTRRVWLLGIVGSALALGTDFPRAARAATLAEIKKRGYMAVATEDDFRPFEFVDDGKPTGYDTELLGLFRSTVAFEVRQDIIPWSGILAGVTTGKYDTAVTAVLITKERQSSLDFTSPVADATDYYATRKDSSEIKGVADLSGRTLGVQAGSAMLARLPELAAMLEKTGGKLGPVIEYPSYPEAYQDLAIGRTDFVVNTRINLQTLVNDKPDIFALGEAVSSKTYIAWALKKGNAELKSLLDDFLLNQRANGKMWALQKKWFGQSFEDMPAQFVAT